MQNKHTTRSNLLRFVCFPFLTECLRGWFFVNFAENFVPLLLVPTAIFLRSLCNVFLRTETRPVREKQIDRTVEGEETRQKAKATKKS